MCQEPVALLPRTSPARRGLPTPWHKDALGQGCIHTTAGGGSEGKPGVRLAVNVLEDLKAVPAAPHKAFKAFILQTGQTSVHPLHGRFAQPERTEGRGNPQRPSLGMLAEVIKSLT